MYLQNPNNTEPQDYTPTSNGHANGVYIVMGAVFELALVKPPGEMGADVG